MSNLSMVVTSISKSEPRPPRTALTRSLLETGSPMAAKASTVDLASWRYLEIG